MPHGWTVVWTLSSYFKAWAQSVIIALQPQREIFPPLPLAQSHVEHNASVSPTLTLPQASEALPVLFPQPGKPFVHFLSNLAFILLLILTQASPPLEIPRRLPSPFFSLKEVFLHGAI